MKSTKWIITMPKCTPNGCHPCCCSSCVCNLYNYTGGKYGLKHAPKKCRVNIDSVLANAVLLEDRK